METTPTTKQNSAAVALLLQSEGKQIILLQLIWIQLRVGVIFIASCLARRPIHQVLCCSDLVQTRTTGLLLLMGLVSLGRNCKQNNA